MSEIYMEGRFKMPVIDTDDLGYDGDEVKKFDWEEFAKDEFWNSCEDMGELEDKYDITFQRVQPQLTIPKSIADEIDKFAHTNWANWQFYFYSDEMSKELIDWFDNGDSEFTNSKIAMVYLNPLTRDLVKVVEG